MMIKNFNSLFFSEINGLYSKNAFLNIILFVCFYYNVLHAAAAKDSINAYNFLIKNKIIDENIKDAFGVSFLYFFF